MRCPRWRVCGLRRAFIRVTTKSTPMSSRCAGGDTYLRVFAEQHGAQPASPLIRGLWFRVGTHYEWGLRLSVPYQPQLPTARNLVLVLIEPRHDLAELCPMCLAVDLRRKCRGLPRPGPTSRRSWRARLRKRVRPARRAQPAAHRRTPRRRSRWRRPRPARPGQRLSPRPWHLVRPIAYRSSL